jgi:hypothetical protein
VSFALAMALALAAAGPAPEPVSPPPVAPAPRLRVSLGEIVGTVPGISNADTQGIIERAMDAAMDPAQIERVPGKAPADVRITGELSSPAGKGYRISFDLKGTGDRTSAVAFDYKNVAPVGILGAQKMAQALLAAALKLAPKIDEPTALTPLPPATHDAVSVDSEGAVRADKDASLFDLIMKEPKLSGYFGINYWWPPYGPGDVAETLLPYSYPAFFIRYSRLEFRGEIFGPEVKYLVGLTPVNPVDLLTDCYVLLDFKWLFGQALIAGQMKTPLGYDYFQLRPLELPLLEHSMIGYEIATQRRYARDLGAGVRGRIKLGKVLITDDFAIMNGQGQDRQDLNSNKDFYGRIGFRYASLISVGASGSYFNDIFRGGEPFDRPDLNPVTISVPVAGYIAAGDLDLKLPYFRIIGEVMWNRLTKPAPNLTRWGFYGIAVATFWHLSAVVRYERFYDDPTNPYQLPDFAPMKERVTVGAAIFVWEGAPQTVQFQVNYQFDPPNPRNNILMFRLNFAFGEANRAYNELR